jgi:hypothetical protein
MWAMMEKLRICCMRAGLHRVALGQTQHYRMAAAGIRNPTGLAARHPFRIPFA